MRILLQLAIILTIGISPTLSNAQAIGDYRSKATGPANWGSAGSWEMFTLGLPNSWQNAASAPTALTTNLITIRLGHTITVDNTRSCGGALTINGTLAFDNSAARTLTVMGDLSGGGTVNMSGGNQTHTLNLGGANNTITTFITSATTASTVNYNRVGNQQVFASVNYRNLTISGSGIKTIQGNATVNNNLSVSGSTFDFGTSARTVNVLGDLIDSGGTLEMDGVGLAHVLNLSGANNDISTFTTTAGSGSTVNYNRASDQQVFAGAASNNYRNLTISGSGIKTIQGNATVNNNLTINGTATLASDRFQLTGNASGTFNMTAGTTLTLGNTGFNTNVLFPTNFTTISLATTSTVIYQNNATQTVSAAPAYGHLTIAGGGTKNMSGNGLVNGNLLVSAGTFNLGTAATTLAVGGTADIDGTLDFGTTTTKAVNISGDLSGAGTVNMSGGGLFHTFNLAGVNNSITAFTTAAGSTVNYNRAGNQQVFASANYQNLTIAGGGNKSFSGTTTVNGQVSLSNGLLALGTNDLVLGTNTIVTGSFSATNMIQSGGGNVIKQFTTTGTFTFPVGTGSVYTPATLNLSSATFTGTGSLSLQPVATAATAQLDATYSLTKHWLISTTNLTNLTADLSFTYADAERNAAAEPGYISAYSLTSPATVSPSSWVTSTGTVNAGSNTISYTGFTSTSGLSNSLWTAGPLTAFTAGAFYSIASASYETASTWSTISYLGAASPIAPTIGSTVYIGNNRTVTMTAGSKSINVLQIDATGILDLGTNTGISIATFNTGTTTGTAGTLRLSAVAAGTATFPTVTGTNNFLNTTGSTVEYNSANSYALPASPIAYQNLTISGSNIKTLQNNATINGNLAVTAGTFNLGAVATTLSVAGTASLTGTLDFGSTTTKAISIGGNLSGAGTLNMSGGALLHTLNLGGATNAITTFNTAAGSTVNYNRAGDQLVFASVNYRNLTISGSGIKTIQGNTTVNNNLSVSSSTFDFGTLARTVNVSGDLINSGGTIEMDGVGLAHVLNLSGANNDITTFTTTAGSGSTVNYNRAGDQQIFAGAASNNYRNLTISGSGIKTLQGNAIINNNLSVNAGTFNLGAVATTLSVAGTASIAGTLDFGTTITKTVSIGGNLSGAGTMNMSGGSLLHTLNLGGTNNAITTFTTAAVGSTVNYNRNDGTSQQVFAGAASNNYRNLTISGSGIKTLQGIATVNGNLSVNGTATLASDIYQLTGNASGTFNMTTGTTLTLGNTGFNTNVLFPTNFTSANISLATTSTVIYQNNATQTVSAAPAYGHLTIAGGGTKNMAGNGIVNGNLSITSGTFNLGTVATTVTVAGTASIAGTLDFGTTTTKTVSISGDLSGAGNLTMTGVGLTHTLNLSGTNNAIGTFNTTIAVGSTVNYNRTGDQQIFASINYRNLTTSGSGIKTLSGPAPGTPNATVNGNLTVDANTTLAFGTANVRRLVLVGDLIAPSGTIDMSGLAHELYLGGVNNALASLFTGSTITSTVYYNGTGAQQVFASYATSSVGTGYKKVNITGTGIKTLQASTFFNGTLTISAGSLAFGAPAPAPATPLTLYVGDNLVGGGGTIDLQNAAHTLFLYGTTNTLSTLTTDVKPSTVNYYRNLGSAQSVFGSVNYRNLTLSGDGTKTLQGATTLANNLSIAGGILEVASQSLTVNGTSNIAATFSDNNSTGTNTLVGNVTVTSSGAITTSNNSPFVFQGGLTNNGTINTTGTGTITFSGAGTQVIDGSAAITMAGAATVATGITLDNKNTALTFPSLAVSLNAKFTNSHAAFPTSYVGFNNGSAMTNKFSSMLASNHAGNAVISTSTSLALTRGGSGSVYALRGLPNFNPVATAMVVKFNLSASTSTSTTNVATLLLGSSSVLTDDANINTGTASIQINLVSSNTFTLFSPASVNYDNTTTRTVTWVINTSGAAVSYVGPDGTTASALANGKADVWVGTTRYPDLSVQTAAQAMNQLKVVMSGGTGTITFNNLSVNPLGTITPSPVTCNNALYVTPFTGATFNVGFSTSGMNAATHFNASNTLTAQLSNSSGSFASPTTIGTLTTTALNGTIPCSIPSVNSGTVVGTGYRIRVVSSSPTSISPDNGTNIAIGSYTVSPYPAQSITTTASGTLLTASGLNVIGYQWGYYTVLGGPITDLVGQNSATYTPNGPNFLGAGIYALICRMTTSTGCVATSNEVIIYVNCPNPLNINLITNGNFSSGNTGFTTDYGYVENIAGVQNELHPEGLYAVGDNPNDYHGAFCNMTTNTQRSPISGGNMLIGNAATTGSVDLWKQTVTVTPYTDYVLTFYATSLAGESNSLFFGIYAGCFRTGADVSVPFQVANCTWNKYSFQLSSGNTNSVQLAIRNISVAVGGNDIAIDDIQFYACDQVSVPPFPVADAFTWRGITNDWFNADNWGSSCGLPTCVNDVIIPVMGTGRFYPTINAAATAGSVTINSGASLTISSGRNLDVCGDFINNGTLSANSTSSVTFTSSKNPQLVQGNATGTNKLGGVIVNKTNSTDVLQFSNTVEIAGGLTLTKGTLDANGQSIKVGGNFTNAGTFTPSGNTVEFNGTGNQQLTQTGTGSFYNLIINNSTASNTITLNPALTTVTNRLTLTKGIVVVGSGKELSVTNTAASAVTGQSASSYVNGNLRRAVSGTQLYNFPVGDASRYELIQVNVTSNLAGTSNILGFFNSGSPGGSNPSFTETGYDYLYTCGPGYWTLTPNAQPSAGTFDLIINPVGISCSDLQQTIAKRANSGGTWGTYGSTAVSSTRRNGFTSFSDVVQTSGNLVSLPIQLLTFEGKLKEAGVLLSWITASELNNEYFEVQRSADLQHYEAIGRIDGAGTTNERRAYQFTDKKPLPGISYYRLRQVDINGNSTKSPVIAIESTIDREKVYLYPNPIVKENEVHLHIDSPKDGSYLVQLYNLKGIELHKEVIRVEKRSNDIVLSCKGLASGVYLVRIVGLNPSQERSQWNIKLIVE